jgi:hypothetical protein
MGFFSKKSGGSNSSSSSPKLSPKLQSQSSRSTISSPKTPSFSKPSTQLPPPPDPKVDPEGYLTSLQAVRQRSQLVYENVRRGQGKCFTLDPGQLDHVIKYVVGIIKVCHSRIEVIDREIMIRRIRVFPLMDVGSISMLVGDNDLNNSFKPGGILTLMRKVVDYWIYSLFPSFWMLELATRGNSRQNKEKSMVVAKVSLWEVWICLKRDCLVVTSRIPTELIVRLLWS